MTQVQWVKREPRTQWLGRVPGTLGATEAEMVQIKTLLSAWAQGEGNQSAAFQDYGTKPGDFLPPFTKIRDGATLESFSVWWNSGGKPPHLATGVAGEGGTVAAPPDAPHLQALQNWAVSKGINPNPGPSPDPVICAQNCQQKYALDPVNLATCLSLCAGQAPPPIIVPPVIIPPPVTPPPVTPPPVTPPPTSPPAESASSNTGLYIAGGIAALAVGALLLSKASPMLQANPPHPKSGYAYAYRGKNWRNSSSEPWDIVMITPANARYMYVGKRHIDGSEVNVWKTGQRYVAQTTVMTGR